MMEDQKKIPFFPPLYDDKLCAVLYEKHPLYGRDRLQLKELKDDVLSSQREAAEVTKCFIRVVRKQDLNRK